jgi:hypothetical protein
MLNFDGNLRNTIFKMGPNNYNHPISQKHSFSKGTKIFLKNLKLGNLSRGRKVRKDFREVHLSAQ